MILEDGFELPHGLANYPKILKRNQLHLSYSTSFG